MPPAPVAHLAGLRAVAPPHATAAHGKALLGEGASSNADLADAPQYPPLSTSHLRWRRSRHARLGDTCCKRVDAGGRGHRCRGRSRCGRVVANRAVAAAAMLAERDCPPAIRALATSAHGSRGPLFFAKGLARFVVAAGATAFRRIVFCLTLGCHDCSRYCSRQERELVNNKVALWDRRLDLLHECRRGRSRCALWRETGVTAYRSQIGVNQGVTPHVSLVAWFLVSY